MTQQEKGLNITKELKDADGNEEGLARNKIFYKEF